jgi:CDP-diacylglycerol--glycerol-3-phosphate 3-phosphatidyltransferase
LTMTRLSLVPVFVLLASIESFWSIASSFFVFCVAVLTDYYDGKVARSLALTTPFGAFMDPIVDKILISSAFICIVQMGLVPAWMVATIVAREFVVTGVRLIAAHEGKVVGASKGGKRKMAFQVITVGFFLFLESVRAYGREHGSRDLLAFADFLAILTIPLMALVLALTLISGWKYVWENRGLILEGR